MNEKVITMVTNLIATKKGYKIDTDEYIILKYYITVIYLDGTKTILFIAISLILNILPYTLAFMLVFGSIREFARGIHFKSNTVCTIVSFTGYLLGIYISIYFSINLITTIIIYLLCFLLNLKFSPSPSENAPIDDLEKPKLKTFTIIIMCLWFIVILLIGESVYRNIMLTATILETIFILPITYKLANEKRG